MIQYEKDLSRVAGSGDGGRGPGAKECRCLLEAGKGKEMNSPQEPTERHTALPTLDFLFSENLFRLLTYRTVR